MSNSTLRPVQLVSNIELYDRWAKVYDIDGNILQSLDDCLLPGFISQAFALLPPSNPVTITELGSGTGRNTVKLLSPTFTPPISHITALDLSPSMLAIARTRCTTIISSLQAPPTITFNEFNALSPPSSSPYFGAANLVLSTLVLEHIPQNVFFQTIKGLLREDGGVVVITNMHAEMGRKSQAGFVDEETGNKVRGESFVYEINEVLEEARRWGFELVGEVGERGVEMEDLEKGVIGHRGKKWVGLKCWFGMVLEMKGT